MSFGADDMLRYNPAGLSDYTHGLMTYSSELDNIAQQAQNTLSGLHEYFDTPQGSVAFTQAQQMINSGIQEGKDVIARHGSTVDNASQEFFNQDQAAGNSFGSI